MAKTSTKAVVEEPLPEVTGEVSIEQAPDGVGVIEKVDGVEVHVTDRAGGGTNRVYL